jgi:hypothetical protein
METPREPEGAGAGLRSLSRGEGVTLAIVVLLGLILRVVYQAGRSFSGDEVGTVESLQRSYGYLLTHFEGVQGEQLTMNWYTVLLKALGDVLGDGVWVLSAPTLVAGLGAIVAVAALTLRLAGPNTALVAALLAAVNPCLVEFSGRLRSYMLLVALSLAAITCFYDWSRRPAWRSGVLCALASCLALIAHPNAVYQMVFLGVLFLLHARRSRERLATIALPMVGAAVVVVAAYAALWSDMTAFREKWSETPPTGWDFLTHTLRIYVAHGWAMWPTLALFGVGLWTAASRGERLGTLALGILVPLLLTSALGVSHYPWTYARFLMPILPLMLVFVARGAFGVAPRSTLVPLVLGAVVVSSWLSRLDSIFEAEEEQPYEEAAAYVESLGPKRNEVLCVDPSTRNHLGIHLDEKALLPKKNWWERLSPDGGRLVVVDEGRPLKTDAPRQRFGAIQVVTYSAPSPAGLLALLVADLQRTLDGRISPRFTDQYELVVELLSVLGREEELVQYVTLYYESLMRSRRQKNAPSQLLERLTTGRHGGR